MRPGLKKGSAPMHGHTFSGRWSLYWLGSLILFSLGSWTVSELARLEGGEALRMAPWVGVETTVSTHWFRVPL